MIVMTLAISLSCSPLTSSPTKTFLSTQHTPQMHFHNSAYVKDTVCLHFSFLIIDKQCPQPRCILLPCTNTLISNHLGSACTSSSILYANTVGGGLGDLITCMQWRHMMSGRLTVNSGSYLKLCDYPSVPSNELWSLSFVWSYVHLYMKFLSQMYIAFEAVVLH